MSSNPELTVLIPALNEAENLKMLVPELQRALDELAVDYEILVVDGGSQDGTEAVVNELGARYLRQAERGYGGALTDGFAVARGDYVLTMDADYSHEPAFVRSLWEHRHDAELLIASRYVPDGRADMSRFRLVLSQVLNRIYRYVLDLPCLDLSSGYRLYRMSALRQVSAVGREFDFLPEVLVRLYAEGYKIKELPFHYRPRREGRSHVMLFRFAFAYFRTLVRLRAVRTSVAAADYDDRAFNSWIPLQGYWQKRRHEIVLGYLEQDLAVLDVGCGSSKIIQTLSRGVGLDFQAKKLRFLRGRADQVLQGSLSRLPFRDESFPQLVCSEVIEHIAHEEVDLAELRRVIRPGGTLVLGTPDYSSWIWVTLERIHGWVFPGGYADEHINPYTETGLRQELEEHGFVVDELRKICRAEMIFRAIKK